MQEYNDGTCGQIMEADKLKEVLDNPEEMAKTKAIHFGTREELEGIKNKTEGAFGASREKEDSTSVKSYLRRIEDKMDMIIKHFSIVHIIGE